MDKNYFAPLLEAAELTDNENVYKRLEKMQSIYEKKQYFVAFIGQFSAGKSSLLNRLLERELLPEGITETTPILTYIRYGETEEAVLHYLNGTQQILTLEEVTELSQQADGNRWNTDELEYLEVFLKDGMLRSGMIMLDTPGVNSLIEKHERLLDMSLSLAAEIVYVTSGAPTAVDKEKLMIFKELGYDITCVRTHCDEINSFEETFEDALKSDRELQKDLEIDEAKCYYVSNIESSIHFNSITPLREMLIEKGKHAGEELDKDIRKQLVAASKKLKEALSERKSLLEQRITDNSEKIQRRRQDITEKIKSLEARKSRIEKTLQKRIKECCDELNNDVINKLEQQLHNISLKIAGDASLTDESEMGTEMRKEASSFLSDAQALINASIDPLVTEINGELAVEEADVNSFAIIGAPNYEEVCFEEDEQWNELAEAINSAKNNADKIEQELDKLNDEKYGALIEEIKNLEQELAESKLELNNLGPYVPKMIEIPDDRPQPSQIMGILGNIADWAMLLIPGGSFGEMFTSMGKSVSNLGKAGATIGKVLNGAANVAKTLDTVKDTMFATRAVVRQNPENLGGADTILDFMSVEYWFRKIGENFDRPPQYKADREYEALYISNKKKLEARYSENFRKALQKKMELGYLADKAAELQAKKEIPMKAARAAANDLKKREKKLKEQARGNVLKKWREDCAARFEKGINEQLLIMIKSYTDEVPARLENYADRRIHSIVNALEKERSELNALMNLPKNEAESEAKRLGEAVEKIADVYGN